MGILSYGTIRFIYIIIWKIMKAIQVKPAMYALFYETLKEIAQKLGYNLLIHGSMNRDLDLVAVPWIDNPRPELELLQAFELYLKGIKTYLSNGKPYDYCYSVLPGGRHSYIIEFNRGNREGEWGEYDSEYYIDISITPLLKR